MKRVALGAEPEVDLLGWRPGSEFEQLRRQFTHLLDLGTDIPADREQPVIGYRGLELELATGK